MCSLLQSGVLQVNRPLDRERVAEYRLTITVKDNPDNPRIARRVIYMTQHSISAKYMFHRLCEYHDQVNTAVIFHSAQDSDLLVVAVLDVNDNRPIFTQTSYRGEISENSLTGTKCSL